MDMNRANGNNDRPFPPCLAKDTPHVIVRIQLSAVSCRMYVAFHIHAQEYTCRQTASINREYFNRGFRRLTFFLSEICPKLSKSYHRQVRATLATINVIWTIILVMTITAHLKYFLNKNRSSPCIMNCKWYKQD